MTRMRDSGNWSKPGSWVATRFASISCGSVGLIRQDVSSDRAIHAAPNVTRPAGKPGRTFGY